MASRLTAQEKDDIWKLRCEGYSTTTIAAVVGRSKSTVKRILKRRLIMRAHELYDLLHKRMAEKGFGGKEITANGGFQKILDIDFCTECDQFHIITEPTEHAIELLKE